MIDVDYVQVAQDAYNKFFYEASMGHIERTDKNEAKFNELRQNVKLVKAYMVDYEELDAKVQVMQSDVERQPNAETSRKINLYQRKLAAIVHDMQKLSGYRNSLRGQ